MTFIEILKELDNGKVVRRKNYSDSFVVFKQIPAHISNRSEAILNMKSLPEAMKILLIKNNLSINYEHQYIIYDMEYENATYAVFDGEDLNASDWEVVDQDTYVG